MCNVVWCGVVFVCKVVVDLLLLFGGYATVFLVSPKRNNSSRVAGAIIPGSLARSAGGTRPKVRKKALSLREWCPFC